MKSLKRAGRWVRTQTRTRPFTSALVVLLIVIVPGYARIESVVHKGNENTKQLVRINEREDAQTKAQSLANCQTRNTATKHGRDRFVQLFSSLDVILINQQGQTVEQQNRAKAFIQTLRDAVPLDPEREDVDCNNDGKLDIKDYAP